MYIQKHNNDNEYHQVGIFWTHFQDDMDRISEALFNAGYYICRTIHGDMVIMCKGDYDEEDLDELDDDLDDDEDGGSNITHFPREY